MKDGDQTVVNDWLVEYTDECTCGGVDQFGHEAHESGCHYEPMVNLKDMSLAERIAVVLDMTAALGTPEVVYRRNPGENTRDAGARLRDEVMQRAEDVLRVIQASS